MPVVYRSRVSILWALIGTITVTAAAIFGWLVLPEVNRVAFTVPQALTLLLIILALDAIILGLAFSSVRADREGVTIRNGLRKRHYPWSEISAISYRRSDPWAHLVPKSIGETERTRRPMVGIQRVDGDRAVSAVATLRQLLREAA
ncbi:PH domain-containing protein [Naumannella halotolerans]|uniref:PH (Pleckstrin Homology) domain-containing protein n=1 Tax=Naumannella halotolerans TaxID=993414 RepID=A0A4R7J6N9_9ACTN|nr:PH domain-containing protein [Naumannella halotolerans]TDT33072.1 PH (Pleckstrin Homology) domain-containing protein [Naumannella halotolerans]